MSESIFLFFIGCATVLFVFAFVIAAWAFLFVGFLVALREWVGIDLLARWRKRK